MHDSSYCLSMKTEYEDVKTEVESVYQYIEDSVSYLNSGIPYMERTIIGGEPLDKGKLSEFRTTLNLVASNLDAIVDVCDRKINYWDDEYSFAIKREQSNITVGEDDDSDESITNES